MQDRLDIGQFIATKVAKISCSPKNDHILLLTHDGTIYTRGSNEHGQLGLGDTQHRKRHAGHVMPIQIPELENMIDVFAGSDFSFCLSADFKVYAFGGNEFGQLGLGNHLHQLTPQPVTYLNDLRIIHIETGTRCAYFLDDSGRVFFSGRLHNGMIYLFPLQVMNLPPIARVFIFSENVFFISRAGEVFACGINNNNELGLNCDGMVVHPRQLTIPPIVDIGRARSNTFFLGSDGKVYGCGRNNNHHLSMCLKEQIVKTGLQPPVSYPIIRLNFFDDDPIAKMSIGGQCNIFLTHSNKVYLQYRYVPLARHSRDEALDTPEAVTIPVPEVLRNTITPPVYVYVNHPTLYTFTADTLEYQRCVELLHQEETWQTRNLLLCQHASSLELCDYYKQKFSHPALSKPKSVLSLKTLSAMAFFKAQPENTNNLPEDLCDFIKSL